MKHNEIKSIIQNIQNQIWEAEYFRSLNVNAAYWQGRIDSYTFTLDHFRSCGVSVSEMTADLQKPNEINGIDDADIPF